MRVAVGLRGFRGRSSRSPTRRSVRAASALVLILSLSKDEGGADDPV
jgi:hypothetical protein